MQRICPTRVEQCKPPSLSAPRLAEASREEICARAERSRAVGRQHALVAPAPAAL